MTPFEDTTLIILAGGRGRRLDRGEKAFVEVAGRPLIHRVLDLHERFAATVLVANPTPALEALGLPLYPDRIPKAGAPGGVATGLEICRTPWACVLACDMPTVNPRVLAALWDLRDGFDAVVPEAAGRLHPLHAFYRAATVSAVARSVAETGGSMQDLLEEVNARIEPIADAASVANVNTPEDLARVEARFRAQGP